MLAFAPSPAVDAVMLEARAADFSKRSLKREAKRAAIDLAIRCIDLTTLEGKDSPGKVESMCAKAVHPGYGAPPVAAVCVYPNMVPVAKAAVAGMQASQWPLPLQWRQASSRTRRRRRLTGSDQRSSATAVRTRDPAAGSTAIAASPVSETKASTPTIRSANERLFMVKLSEIRDPAFTSAGTKICAISAKMLKAGKQLPAGGPDIGG